MQNDPTPNPRTNDPAEFLALVREARSGEELVALLRPGDLKRQWLLGHHAPARAIDKALLDAVKKHQSLAFALLQNDNLALVDPQLLADFAIAALEHWIRQARGAFAIDYVIALTSKVPELKDLVIRRIRGLFEVGQFRRNSREGAAAGQIYLLLVDVPDREFVGWLIDRTGNQARVRRQAVFHPSADKEMWVNLVHADHAIDAKILKTTPAWEHPEIRAACYERETFVNVIPLLAEEENEDILQKWIKRLAGRGDYDLLSRMIETGRPISRRILMTFLESPSSRTRELAITCTAELGSGQEREGREAGARKL